MWGEQLQMAWQSLRANTFRSLLTMLGIIIGSSTLVSVLSLGNALQGQVFERFIDLGTRRVAVLPGDADAAGARITSGYGLLSIKDFRALEKLVADRPDIFRTVVPEVAIQVRARSGSVDLIRWSWVPVWDTNRFSRYHSSMGAFLLVTKRHHHNE